MQVLAEWAMVSCVVVSVYLVCDAVYNEITRNSNSGPKPFPVHHPLPAVFQKKTQLITYNVRERLGKGVFGTVDRIRITSSEIPHKVHVGGVYALKTTRIDSWTPDREEEFMKHIKGTKNTIKLHHSWDDKSQSSSSFLRYFVFDVYDCDLLAYLFRTNEKAIRVRKKFPLSSHAIKIVSDIAQGLQSIHQRDLFHRDLKPENIFLTVVRGRLTAHLADFGCSSYYKPSHHTQINNGRYPMPPELNHQGRYDEASDIWYLGHICHDIFSEFDDYYTSKWYHRVNLMRREQASSRPRMHEIIGWCRSQQKSPIHNVNFQVHHHGPGLNW